MFGIDHLDTRHASGLGGRFICLICGLGFDSALPSQICADCIEREPTPIQDNEPAQGGFFAPKEAPEIVVARKARQEAEQQAAEYRRAMLFLHQVVTSIAGAAERPLRLLPRDQHKVARLALEQFAADFPRVLARMDLHGLLESGIIDKNRGIAGAHDGGGGEGRLDRGGA